MITINQLDSPVARASLQSGFPAHFGTFAWRFVKLCIFAALALFFAVFLRGSHNVFFLGLVNGAVLAACCCLRDAPRKTYHLSQP